MSGDGPKLTRQDIVHIFELRFAHGFHPTEIAEKMDCSREHVYNLLAGRVRKQITRPLQQAMAKHQDPLLLRELERLQKENATLRRSIRAFRIAASKRKRK